MCGVEHELVRLLVRLLILLILLILLLHHDWHAKSLAVEVPERVRRMLWLLPAMEIVLLLLLLAI